jgi:hypothetical protein
MRTKAMNKGVQILLERMGSNPEEFYTANQKWVDVISIVTTRMKHIIICREEGNLEITSSSLDSRLSLCPLKDEEVIALHTKLKAIASEEFTYTVMSRLLTEKPDASYDINYDSSVGGKLKAAIKGAP